jgi:hypothetical protein
MNADDVQLSPKNWGLDRIDDITGLDGSYEYGYTGDGVHAYVLDTPMTNQTEFGPRYASCTSFTNEICGPVATHLHGSHVAGARGRVEDNTRMMKCAWCCCRLLLSCYSPMFRVACLFICLFRQHWVIITLIDDNATS